ncbi:hypothetical protein PV682_38855 [Streptomyces niveiscabiei]|uniref:hypothetical protein n=1 Tax=Streptomyces niveiscabiei TaxID=164115 RepID=UPI0029BC071D|nr:hypothetical protein [Streptomyces niveiscabiei]MDX3387361.1 hypothetical protein [Streptomyces niveiscabiei]
MTFDKGPGIPAELAGQPNLFVGREWALAEITSWYKTAEPLLVISAEPGVGKSALAVQLVRISHSEMLSPQGPGPTWLHAWHFCQAQQFSSLNIRDVLEQLAGQLCATLPGYAEAVAYRTAATTVTVNQEFTGAVRNSTVVGINRLILPDIEPRHLLDTLFRKPLSELGTHAVILIDAVDETEEQTSGPQTLARLLSTLRTDPVPGLRLVLTTRNGLTTEYFSHGRQLRLRDDEPAGAHDVQTYLQGRLHDRGITDPTLVAQLIAQVADGNFLYAALAASEDAERLNLLASGERVLPHGLGDLYTSFLGRQVTADPGRWREVIRPVLGFLVQSRGNGFTRRQLAQLTGLRQSAVDDALELCAPYLQGPRPDGPFVPFHGSLRDHLRQESRHGVYPRESTEQIIATFRADATDSHGVEYLLGYMADRVRLMVTAQGTEYTVEHNRQQPPELRDLEETVTDCGYLVARIAATGVDSLLNEITALHSLLPESSVLSTMRAILGRQAHNLHGGGASGEKASFTTQQLLYESSVSGRSGLLHRSHEHEPVISTFWSATGENSRLLSHTLATSEYNVDAGAMSEDGTRTALCGFTWHGNDMHKTVQVFDTKTGSTIREFPPTENTMRVFSLRFSDDGRRLVALRVDRTGMVWDLSSGTGKPLTPDEFTEPRLSSLPVELPPYAIPEQVPPEDLANLIIAATPDRRYAAVCERGDSSVIMWDLTNRTVLGHFDTGLVRALAISPDGRWVVVGSALGGAHVLTPLSPTPRLVLDGHRGTVRAASLRDSHAATLGDDGDLKIWDAATGRLLRTERRSHVPHGEDTLALGSEASLYAVGTYAGNAALFDMRLGSRLRPLMVNGNPCDEDWRTRDGARDEALPPVGGGDCPREHWPTRVNDRHGSPVSALDISPDDRHIVTGTLNGVVRVWDADTGNLVREVTRGEYLVRAARFTSDGNHLITVAQLGGPFLPMWLGVEKWNLGTGELTQVLWPDETHAPFPIPNDDSVASLTRDGRYLATGHRNGTVTVHDLAARQRVGHLVLHGAITCLAFDGPWLLAGTANGDVTLAAVRQTPESGRG